MESSTFEENLISCLKGSLKESDEPQRLSARQRCENTLYEYFFYLIRFGTKEYRLQEDVCASVYSDTIISVIDNIVKNMFKGEASLKTYINKIFMNKCVDASRKETTAKNNIHRNSTEIDRLMKILPDEARTPVQELINKSNRDTLMQIIQTMDEKYKKLLMLFEDGYSDKEIAQMLGYNSPEVVRTTRYRCFEKLREMYLKR